MHRFPWSLVSQVGSRTLLTFDTIIAARAAIFNGANPLVVRKALMDIESGQAQESLLWILVNEQQFDEQKAREAHGQKQKYLFRRAESAYIHCIRHFKHADEKELEAVRKDQSDNNYAQALDHYLIKAGVLSVELNTEIKRKALKSLTQENDKVVNKSRESGFFDIEGIPAPVKESFGADGNVAISQIVDAEEARQMLANLDELIDDDDSEMPEAPPPPSAAADLKRDLNSTRSFPNVEASGSLGDPLKNTGLDERYQVLDKLGQGGMGAVYLALDKDFDDRRVALKIAIPAEDNEDAEKRFKREILCNSFFDHPGVIEIYDGGKTASGHFYMAMEYFRGQPLSDRIEEQGPFKIRECLDIFRQGMEALAAAHQAQIIHRDLKPENFMIADKGPNNYEVKLMDFGIARIMDENQQFSDQFFRTMAGKLTGSPAYIPPESITGDPIDGRADLYSMGISLYELCVGRLPFKAPTATEYLSKHLYEKIPDPCVDGAHRGVNKELGAFIMKLMQKLPKQRYQSAEEVLEVLKKTVIPSYQAPTEPQQTKKLDPKKLTGALEGTDVPAPPLPTTEPVQPDENAESTGSADAPSPESPTEEQTPIKDSPTPTSNPKKEGWFQRLKRFFFGSK
jgi:serine/threonine protein kinase